MNQDSLPLCRHYYKEGLGIEHRTQGLLEANSAAGYIRQEAPLSKLCVCAGEGLEGDVQGEEDQGLLIHEKEPAGQDAQAHPGWRDVIHALRAVGEDSNGRVLASCICNALQILWGGGCLSSHCQC